MKSEETGAREKIARMEAVERMTHAAAVLSGNPQRMELADFHEWLRAEGFDFGRGLCAYLANFRLLNRDRL